MAELNLEWIEAGSLNTRQILPNQTTQQPQLTRIGRDPNRCDIVLADGSVSGLHVEIGFDPSSQAFYLQNLRESNPPIVNGQPLPHGRVLLQAENIIQLGNVQLRAIASYSLPATEVSVPVHSPPPESVPPTDLQVSPAPPTVPPPIGQDFAAVNPTPQPGYTPGVNPYHYQPPSTSTVEESEATGSSAPSRWVFLGFGGLLIALFALAWPNISGFLGLGRGTVVSESNMPEDKSSAPEESSAEDSSPETSGDRQVSMSDLESYTHDSGLFGVNVPKDWEFLDNSQPGDIVIQGWHHPQLNSYVIVRIFEANRSLDRSQLQEFGTNVVQELFGDLDNFQRGDPTPLLDRSVRVQWAATDGPETLLASTFVRQDGLNLSALTVWVPEGRTDSDSIQQDIDRIVASYEVNPNVKIP